MPSAITTLFLLDNWKRLKISTSKYQYKYFIEHIELSLISWGTD